MAPATIQNTAENSDGYVTASGATAANLLLALVAKLAGT